MLITDRCGASVIVIGKEVIMGSGAQWEERGAKVFSKRILFLSVYSQVVSVLSIIT